MTTTYVDWPLGASQGSFNAGIGNAAAAYWPTIAAQQTTMPLDWNWGIMWNITVPLPMQHWTTYTVNAGRRCIVLASWSIAGADGNYVILQTGKGNPIPQEHLIRTLAAINVGTCQ